MSKLSMGPTLPPGFNTGKSETLDEDQSTIGPVLPPHLQNRQKQLDSNDSEKDIVTNYSARLPEDGDAKTTAIGPVLPPHLLSKHGSTGSIETTTIDVPGEITCYDKMVTVTDNNDTLFGPSVTTVEKENVDNDLHSEKQNIIGPALPPGLVKRSVDTSPEDNYGPALPPGFQLPAPVSDEESELATIGPLPGEMMSEDSSLSAAVDFEQRAKRMKDKLTLKDEPVQIQRETWMTELPKSMKKNFGLTARTFSRKAGPETGGDTSAWTDTPADKERKLQEAEQKRSSRLHDSESHHSSSSSAKKHKKDREYDEQIKKHKSKRGESLLDRHEKERKKKKKKEKEKAKVRQPFDRERDLQVNKFDDAQRRSIINKSRELDTRFNHGGSTSSFL